MVGLSFPRGWARLTTHEGWVDAEHRRFPRVASGASRRREGAREL